MFFTVLTQQSILYSLLNSLISLYFIKSILNSLSSLYFIKSILNSLNSLYFIKSILNSLYFIVYTQQKQRRLMKTAAYGAGDSAVSLSLQPGCVVRSLQRDDVTAGMSVGVDRVGAARS